MLYTDFKNKVIEHLCSCLDSNRPRGQWHKKGEYEHIVGDPNNPKEKAEIINRYLLLDGVDAICSEKIHLHQYAHHVNSSQIMCYNFFRPLMDDWNTPKKKLLQIISGVIGQKLDYSREAFCQFEYVEKNKKENTNFDFYVTIGDIEVFLEIKYTEYVFSKKSSASNPHQQWVNVYEDMIQTAVEGGIINKGSLNENDFNTYYYQLARNSIRAKKEKKYVLFVCPAKHPNLEGQFDEFANKCLTECGKKYVKFITWEELVDKAAEYGADKNAFTNRYLKIQL